MRGPIIFVEDDLDDQELLKDALQELKIPNDYKFFANGLEALYYLETTADQPFIIFSDINMPLLNGIELRNQIFKSEYLREKSIPFVFLTTASNNLLVKQAYDLSVQGFFKKPETFPELQSVIKQILEYWHKCKHPNS
ncbi:MAG: histidine kinase [Segetibacter sp.]|nr:histidine kinase [Segetibacter sp.]